jgi:AcrR family transcriptional regulator
VRHDLLAASARTAVATESDYEERLLTGMLEAIGEIGWADLTIAEVVRRARVSKRTFYEHFPTKEACLLALYERESSRLLDDLDATIEKIPLGELRVAEGARFYLEHLRSRPRVVRTVTMVILQLGSEGLAVRRRVMRRFAALLQREINSTGVEPPISLEVAMVLVGGINEITLEALEENRIDRLDEFVVPIADVIVRMLGGALPTEKTKPRRPSR